MLAWITRYKLCLSIKSTSTARFAIHYVIVFLVLNYIAATSQEMMRKNIQGPGEVKEFYFESGKIDILKENLGKLK